MRSAGRLSISRHPSTTRRGRMRRMQRVCASSARHGQPDRSHDRRCSINGRSSQRPRVGSRHSCSALQPDILHAHSPCLNGLAAIRAARRHRLPFVYEMRASWEDAAVDHGTTTEGSIRYRLSRALETYVLKRADAITTICGGLAQDIQARGIAQRTNHDHSQCGGYQGLQRHRAGGTGSARRAGSGRGAGARLHRLVLRLRRAGSVAARACPQSCARNRGFACCSSAVVRRRRN